MLDTLLILLLTVTWHEEISETLAYPLPALLAKGGLLV